MPEGHTKSRKAIVDALVSGCIPIVFDMGSLHYLWPYQINDNIALQISYYYPKEKLVDKPSVQSLYSWLTAIRDSEEIILKRRVLGKIARNLQFSLPVISQINQTKKNIDIDIQVREQQFKDAFDIILESLFVAVNNLN